MSLQKHVNNSGFPLQLAISNLVKNNTDWNVLYEEHYWVQEPDNGFIDLVIEDQHQTWLMNIECKRVRDTKWIFLRDKKDKSSRSYSKVWVSSKKEDESLNHFGWVDITMEPGFPQSSYCIIPGQDPKARPMLERTASIVVKSTEALALQETKTLSNYYSHLRIYQNVILTTAELYVCDANVQDIDISTGELDDKAEFTKVPIVRFRKQVGAIPTEIEPAKGKSALRTIIRDRESTVFIVNSSYFNNFLSECELPDNIAPFISLTNNSTRNV